MERYKWHKRSHLQSRDRGAGVESTTREAPRTLQWALFPSTGGLPDSGVEPRSPDPDNHNGEVTHLEPDILECEVKWALGSITTNKTIGSDGIPVELFKNPQK